MVLEKTLGVTWTARRSSQSILKEISPGCSLEGLMLKLKFQYFDHLIRRTDSFEKTLMLGKIEGERRPTGLPSKRGPGLGSSSRADRGIGGVRHVAPPSWLVSNFLVRPASS